jgi:hypothetical protein
MPATFRPTRLPQEAMPVLPMPKAEMEKRLAYAKAHPYEPHRTAGPICDRCKSAMYARVVRKFGVPVYESICTGGHSAYLGRIRSSGRIFRAAA